MKYRLDKTGQVKVADFGLACEPNCEKREYDCYQIYCAQRVRQVKPRDWMAPESKRRDQEKFSEKSDVVSLNSCRKKTLANFSFFIF